MVFAGGFKECRCDVLCLTLDAAHAIAVRSVSICTSNIFFSFCSFASLHDSWRKHSVAIPTEQHI
jgi:hypothetical protein